MNIKFDPNNVIVKLCMSGMGLEEIKETWGLWKVDR